MTKGMKMQRLFFNELIVWRELARNFCYYNPLYNEFEGIPNWARQTLEEHLNDRREYVYSLKDLEEANTHDSYWNAAQRELLKTGKMHNYMRMYWCKKLIEWAAHPKEAFNIACYLSTPQMERTQIDIWEYLGVLELATILGQKEKFLEKSDTSVKRDLGESLIWTSIYKE